MTPSPSEEKVLLNVCSCELADLVALTGGSDVSAAISPDALHRVFLFFFGEQVARELAPPRRVAVRAWACRTQPKEIPRVQHFPQTKESA